MSIRASNHLGAHGGALRYYEPSYRYLPSVWDAFGELRLLELPIGYNNAVCWAINDFGEAAGEESLQPSLFWDASGTPHQLPSLGGFDTVEVNGMNNAGQVVGSGTLAIRTESHAYVWSLDTGMIDLGDLNPDEEVTSVAYDINDDGLIVGRSHNDPKLASRAVCWEDGVIRELPRGSAVPDRAPSVNEARVILGFTGSSTGPALCIWPSPDDDPILLLDPYQSTTFSLSAVAINNNNIVIGDGGTNRSTALIWYDWDKQPVKLTDLLPWGSRWTLRASYSLNDHNQIGGLAFHNGRDTGFVATPVYPSIVMSEASPGIAGEMNIFQISNLRPNERVHLVAGKYGGGALIPGCSMLQNVLQIDHPKTVTTTTADALGNATIEGFVPAYLRGQTRVLQAVTPGTCEISNLVVQTFN